jgi:hypothetical protein
MSRYGLGEQFSAYDRSDYEGSAMREFMFEQANRDEQEASEDAKENDGVPSGYQWEPTGFTRRELDYDDYQ